ncbi:hypothetical protein D3C84_790160 [compost metagenome]
MEIPAQPQRQIDRQYLVLHHGAQCDQADAADQYDADTPQHSTFLRLCIATRLPGGEQVHDLAKKGKQPGFVNRHTGTEQRKHKDIAAGASGAGPQEPHQADRWRRCFIGWERVESSFKHTKHCGLRKYQVEAILPSNDCFGAFAGQGFGTMGRVCYEGGRHCLSHSCSLLRRSVAGDGNRGDQDKSQQSVRVHGSSLVENSRHATEGFVA